MYKRQLPIVPPDDARQLAAWNQTEAPYPRGTRVEALIASTARRVPDQVAIHATDRALTYAALLAEADAITAALVAAGVAPGARVGLVAERDSHMVPMLLGILGAGAAYVPLDPSFPADRLDQVFDPFVRGFHEPTVPGTGIGLAVCRAIVAAHGGTIRAENADGIACVRFALPLGTPPEIDGEPS